MRGEVSVAVSQLQQGHRLVKRRSLVRWKFEIAAHAVNPALWAAKAFAYDHSHGESGRLVDSVFC